MSSSPWRISELEPQDKLFFNSLSFHRGYIILEPLKRIEELSDQETSIGDLFAELAASVPMGAWDDLPEDLSSRFRYYSF